MARFVEIQTNFTTGELDPLVRARVELKAYDNALETAKNVICQPQGGVTPVSYTHLTLPTIYSV